MVKFAHASLSCKDPLAIERFYTKHFGFQRARVVPIGDEQIVFLRAGEVYLELFQAHGESPVPRYDKDGPVYPCIRHIAFQVDDIAATLAAMGADARITLGPIEFNDFIPGWRTVWVSDPGGNIVEISQGYVDQKDPPPFSG